MGRKVVLLMAFALAGCLPTASKEMAACHTEAGRFYHTYQAIDPDDPSSQYIIECMAAKGYRFDALAADCDDRSPMPTQATCYEPNGWFDWAIDQIRRALTSKSATT
jgi:hypothetical protein